MRERPYYPPPSDEPPWRWLSPEFFVERQRLLALPGSRVLTPQGREWDPRPLWNGGDGGPPAGSVVCFCEEEASHA